MPIFVLVLWLIVLSSPTWALPLNRGGSVPDTVEIYAFKVQFRFEETDNSLTTGRGHFDSDADTASANYSLDPQGSRASAAYWEKHFDFVDNYFRSASGGRLVVENRIFPTNQNAYQLDKFLIDYNRTARRRDEKAAEFDEARARDYMTFVRDAVRRALADPAGPFADSLPQSPHRHRVFLIIHAGASRLVDGGSLGTGGADTPGDFMDVYVPADSWSLLAGIEEARADSAGLVLSGSPLDTLRQIMVVSETASQDGLNWGINGILVHQLARHLGLPATYDMIKGVSRLGWFDPMDFAGYNAGNGFFPVLPSAWLRAHMGWAEVLEVRPGDSAITSVRLAAAGSGLGTEIVRIPINTEEYLLVENRQRSHDEAGTISVTLDGGTRTVPADSLHLVFQDSICNPTTGACVANSRKARGIVTNVSGFDAALPGSGLAVWHINEWYLRDAMPLGGANFWGGDTFRDHRFGISLVEADGILTIGKEFKDALGRPAFDYGSGADLLPHVRNKSSDTVYVIGPGGYANTGSTNAGASHFALRVPIPANSRREQSFDAFRGDSLINYGSLFFDLEIIWGDLKQRDSRWPRVLAPGYRRRSLVTLPRPDLVGEQAVVVVSDQGWVQLLDARGDTLRPANISLNSSGQYLSADSAALSIYALGSALGTHFGSATQDSTLYTLHSSGLWRFILTRENDSTIGFMRDSLLLSGARVGPLVHEGGVWIADSLGLRRASGGLSPWVWEQVLTHNSAHELHDLALCGDVDGDGLSDLVVVGSGGRLWLYRSGNSSLHFLDRPTDWAGSVPTALGNLEDQHYNLACTDFDRDQNPDVFVIGSLGAGWKVSLAQNRTLAPARLYRRGWVPADAQATRMGELYHERGGVALGDLDNDGYPEAIFGGYNTIWAVDKSGVAKPGFPVRLSRGLPEAPIYSDPLLVDLNGDNKLEILLATPAGLVYAFSANGQPFKQDFGSLASLPGVGAGRPGLNAWPLTLGSQNFGDPIPLHITLAPADSITGLELFGVGGNFLSAFHLPQTLSRRAVWGQSAGNQGRTNWLDPATLSLAQNTDERPEITEFFMFPNPVKGGRARMRFVLGAPAQSAVLRLYDISGLEVFRREESNLTRGSNQWDNLDLSHLGSDVYSASLTVHFAGKKMVRWTRVGVVR